MDLEKHWGLETGKRTHSGSAAIELCKFTPAFCAGIKMSGHCGYLDRCQLSIEIGGELFTEMLTRHQKEGNIEDGEYPNGSSHLLQAAEFSNGSEIALERDDNLVEFV